MMVFEDMPNGPFGMVAFMENFDYDRILPAFSGGRKPTARPAVAAAKSAPEGTGDTWTWTALDADSKMILSYFVGGRDSECAM